MFHYFFYNFLFVRSCAIFILLNGVSDSLVCSIWYHAFVNFYVFTKLYELLFCLQVQSWFRNFKYNYVSPPVITSHKRMYCNVFTPVYHSVQSGDSVWGSLSRVGTLSGGISVGGGLSRGFSVRETPCMVKSGQYASCWNIFLLRESIPVGCVTSTAVAVGGRCLPGRGLCIPACTEADPPPVDRILETRLWKYSVAEGSLTDSNITLPPIPFFGSRCWMCGPSHSKWRFTREGRDRCFRTRSYTSSRQFPSTSVYKQQHIDCFQRNINIRYHVSSTSQ